MNTLTRESSFGDRVKKLLGFVGRKSLSEFVVLIEKFKR